MNKKEIKKPKIISSNTILMYCIAILLSTTIIFNTFRLTAFNTSFYFNEYEKNNLYYQGFERQYIKENTKILLDYLRYDKTNNLVNTYLFNEDEKIHLLEVKGLIQRALAIANVSLLLFIIFLFIFYFLKNKKEEPKKTINYLSKILIYSGILNIALIILFALSIIFNFDFIFTIFHKVLFIGQWQFPFTSNMIMMFPSRFFFDIAVRIALSIVIVSLAIIILSLILRKYYISNKN